MCKCCSPGALYVFTALGVLLGGGLVAVAILGPNYLDSFITQGIIDQRVITSNQSKGYAQWVSSDFDGAPPQYFKVFMFNCTNHLDVVNNGAKPKLTTLGPFVYRYHWHRFDNQWSEDGEYVTNYKFETYVYDAESSNGLDPKTTYVITPNLPFLGFRAKIEQQSDLWWTSLGLDLLSALAEGIPFTNVTVHEYVWGYHSPFLVRLKEIVGDLVPIEINTFFSIQQNATTEDDTRKRYGFPNTYHTGKNNISLAGGYVKLRGKANTDIWGTQDNNEANAVYGTDGTAFGIKLFNGPPITVYSEDVCRHLEFDTNDTKVVKGITLLKYSLGQVQFQNYTVFPQYNLYAPAGVSNLTSLFNETQSSPLTVISSQPYFFGSDPWWLNQLDFDPPVQWDPENHCTFLYVEPNTGLLMEANKRLQISVKMEGTLMLFPNMSSWFIPVVYFDESGSLNDMIANQFHSTLGLGLLIKQFAPYALYGLAGLSLIFATFCLGFGLRNKKRGGYHPIEAEDTNDWQQDTNRRNIVIQ